MKNGTGEFAANPSLDELCAVLPVSETPVPIEIKSKPVTVQTVSLHVYTGSVPREAALNTNAKKQTHKKSNIGRRQRKSKTNVKYWEIKAEERTREMVKAKNKEVECEVNASSKQCDVPVETYHVTVQSHSVLVQTGPVPVESESDTLPGKSDPVSKEVDHLLLHTLHFLNSSHKMTAFYMRRL